MLHVLLLITFAFAAEKPNSLVCVEVLKYDKKECRKNVLGGAAKGALIGGATGYVFGGRKAAKWGAVAGGVTGATTEESCTITPVEECLKWEEPKVEKVKGK